MNGPGPRVAHVTAGPSATTRSVCVMVERFGGLRVGHIRESCWPDVGSVSVLDQ